MFRVLNSISKPFPASICGLALIFFFERSVAAWWSKVSHQRKICNFYSMCVLRACVCVLFFINLVNLNGVYFIFHRYQPKHHQQFTKPNMGMSPMFIGPFFIPNTIPASILGFSVVFSFSPPAKVPNYDCCL